MSKTQHIQEALSLYRQVTARLAAALNRNLGTSLPTEPELQGKLVPSLQKLLGKFDHIWTRSESFWIERRLWNVAAIPLSIDYIPEIIDWLEGRRQDVPEPLKPIADEWGTYAPEQVADAFRHQAQVVEQAITGSRLQRTRPMEGRNAEIVDLASANWSNAQIAQKFFMEIDTVKKVLDDEKKRGNPHKPRPRGRKPAKKPPEKE